MKPEIMRLSNELCRLLSACDDDDFVDKVCGAVACNEYFDAKEIAAAAAEEAEE